MLLLQEAKPECCVLTFFLIVLCSVALLLAIAKIMQLLCNLSDGKGRSRKSDIIPEKYPGPRKY